MIKIRDKRTGIVHLLGADLTRANLRVPDLTRANLRVPDLTRANLRVPDLTRANLRGANLSIKKVNTIHLKNPRILDLLDDWTDDEIRQTIAEAKIAIGLRQIWDEMSDKEKEAAWHAASTEEIQWDT